MCVKPYCQDSVGFHKTFDLGYSGTVFNNMLLDNDTLYIYGTANDTTPQIQWGVLFARADTSGNLIDYKIHFDSLGDQYVMEPDYSIIKTSDNCFVVVGSLFNRNSGFLMKLDRFGNLIFVKEYPDSLTLTLHQRKVIEIKDGFLIGGHKQTQSNNTADIFLLKTDLMGNKIWEKKFFSPDIWDQLGSLKYLDDNTIIIGAGRGSANTSPENSWVQSRLIAVDSSGIIKWEWNSDIADKQGGIVGLNKTEEGGWIYITNYYLATTQDPYAVARRIGKLDSVFNNEWVSVVSDVNYLNQLYNLIPANDGNWVAAGQKNDFPDIGNKGWIYKISDTGDSLWSLKIVEECSTGQCSNSYFTGLVVLPSKNIIACGQVRENPPVPKLLGWLVKVNQYGCFDTTNCDIPSGIVEDNAPQKELIIYPNPFASQFTVELPDGSLRYELVDITGRVVKAAPVHSMKFEVEGSKLPSGTYWLKAFGSEVFFVKKLIKN